MQCGDGSDQCRGLGVETVTEHMNGRATPSAGKFDAVDQLHVQRLRRRAGFFQAFNCVVIGQGQDSHTFLERTRYQYRWRQSAIGSGAMAMQVNFHGDLITSS